MWCGYQPFNVISLWNPLTEQSSGLSLSCATKEPSTCGQPPTTSPGSSTTLWMWLGSCWPVWQLLYLSSQSVVWFVYGSLLKQERRRKGNICIWELEQVYSIDGTRPTRRSYDKDPVLLWQNDFSQFSTSD